MDLLAAAADTVEEEEPKHSNEGSVNRLVSLDSERTSSSFSWLFRNVMSPRTVPHQPMPVASISTPDVVTTAPLYDDTERLYFSSEHEDEEAFEEQDTSPSSRVYVDKVGEWDVLSERGGKANHHSGNKRYRKVVSEMRAMYRDTLDKRAKTDLSKSIMEYVGNYGGLYLKKDKEGRYYVMSNAEARRKTSQTLRETKQLKWTDVDVEDDPLAQQKMRAALEVGQESVRKKVKVKQRLKTSVASGEKSKETIEYVEDTLGRKVFKTNKRRLSPKPPPDVASRQDSAAAIAAIATSSRISNKTAELATTKRRGVTVRPSGQWQVQVYYAGQSRYIGVFETKEKAFLAHEIARDSLKPWTVRRPFDAYAAEAAVKKARVAAFVAVIPTAPDPSSKERESIVNPNRRKPTEQKIRAPPDPDEAHKETPKEAPKKARDEAPVKEDHSI